MLTIVKKKFFFVVSLFSLCSSKIISGIDTINYNQNFNFATMSISANQLSQLNSAGRVYPCTTSIADFDLFIAEQDIATSKYISHTLAIGSPHPFYVAKKAASLIDFSSDLNLKDTSLFAFIDTVRTKSDGCYFPYINPARLSKPDPFPRTDILLVVKNSQNRYVLNILKVVIGVSYSPSENGPGVAHSYDKGYVDTWFIQTDNTLNFKSITSVKQAHRNVMKQQLIPGSAKQEYFTILGQRLQERKISRSNLVIERSVENQYKRLLTINSR